MRAAVTAFFLSACAAHAVLDGRWEGTIHYPQTHSVGMAFELHEDGGVVTGTEFIDDPKNGGFLFNGVVHGTRVGDDVEWSSDTDLKVRARLNGSQLEGTLEFPAEDPLAVHRPFLSLTRKKP